jgi:Helix-turn-helix domain
MREVVRSGRRANFYMTENSFIDHYAGDVGTTGVAVYHVLQRHANCETHSTWIGTAKMAKLLNLKQRTIQRTIKKLESLRLIRVVRSENMTTFYIDPVPPRAKTTSTPLFDRMPEPLTDQGDTDVASTTPLSRPATVMSPDTTSPSRDATSMSRANDTHVALYKEEQNLSNKTKEQDFLNKTFEQGKPEIHEAARRVIKTLGLTNEMMDAAVATVEITTRGTKLSMDEVVTKIWKEADPAERRGVPRKNFLADFLVRKLAERILDEINLPPTNNVITTVAAALKAEAKDRELGLEETATLITTAAIEDRRRGTLIDRFYFENCKWRSNAGISKAERRKLDNLEANARVKQRLRDHLQGS